MDYSSLITSSFNKKPKFVASVLATTAGQSQAQALLASMPPSMTDVDAAVGVQLDTIGLWVGISRKQQVPITGAFFSFDTDGLGWDQGSWLGPYESTSGITVLDDETYRAVLRAKIGSNYWDGSVEQVNEIASASFSNLGVQCFVIDNFDMSVTIYILGNPSAVLLELIKRGICPPKTAGVRVAGYILASEPDAPFFALDVYTTTEVAGLDFGSFGDPV